jgi:hypothetical protein
MLCVGVTVAVYFAYFSGYEALAYHPAPIYDEIDKLLLYVVIYFGAIFTTQAGIAALIGAASLVTSTLMYIIMLLRSSHEMRSAMFPWLLFQLYAVGTSVMAAIGRSGFGVGSAMVSRYASLPALFWISLVVTVTLYWQRSRASPKWSKLTLAFAGIMTGLLIVSMYQVGIRRAHRLFHRASFQPLVSLSVQLGMPDVQAIQLSITPYPSAFIDNIPALAARGHVPFEKGDKLCGALDQEIDPNLLNHISQDKLQGYFDFLDRYADKGARVVGWAYDPDQQVKCIALLNEESLIRGLAVPGFRRPDVAQVLGLPDQHTGWIGYVRVLSENERLTAYALLADSERWIPLRNSHSFEAPGEVDFSVYRHMIEYDPPAPIY